MVILFLESIVLNSLCMLIYISIELFTKGNENLDKEQGLIMDTIALLGAPLCMPIMLVCYINHKYMQYCRSNE